MNAKWMLRFMLLVLVIGLHRTSTAQAGTPERIQALLHGTLSGHLARSLSDRLGARPGVLLCRIDPASHNLLLHVDPSFGMSGAGLAQFFRVHGITLRCMHRGPMNVPFSVLDPRACAEQEMHR